MKPGRTTVKTYISKKSHLIVWLLAIKLIDAARVQSWHIGSVSPSKYPFLIVQHAKRCQIPAGFPTCSSSSFSPVCLSQAWAQNSIHSCIAVSFIKAKQKPAPERGTEKRGRTRRGILPLLEWKKKHKEVFFVLQYSQMHAVINMVSQATTEKRDQSPISAWQIFISFIFWDNEKLKTCN